MPPRISNIQRLGAFNLCLRPSPKPATASLLPMTQTASLTRDERKKISRQDPYRWARMQQVKAARQEVTKRHKEEHLSERGDAVRGFTTPFLESFDSAGQAPMSKFKMDDNGNQVEEAHPLPTSPHILNNQLSRQELDDAIETAYVLTKYAPPASRETTDAVGEEEEQRKMKAAVKSHAIAVEALNRIVHLDNSSGKDQRHANIRRIIENFGRHNTDLTVQQKPLSRGQEPEEKSVRGGPDTGSSEVQIAILTAKIRALANELEKNHGHRDKHNKRSLRLMVHRRQKLLKYMERKERGSGRWTHMIETLGLSPATWKGEITL